MSNVIKYESIIERKQACERARTILAEKSDKAQYIETVNIMQSDYDECITRQGEYIIALKYEIGSLYELINLYERYVVLLGGVLAYEMTEN